MSEEKLLKEWLDAWDKGYTNMGFDMWYLLHSTTANETLDTHTITDITDIPLTFYIERENENDVKNKTD